MNRLFVSLILVCVALVLAPRPAAAITIPTVPVGNAGNGNDLSTGSRYGGVAYDFRIGTYEVTVGQYTEFLNAVAKTDTYDLYSPFMASSGFISHIVQSGVVGGRVYSVVGSPNKPVTFVSWGDAARFSNWLHNGQPVGKQDAGTTENGAYALNGAVTDAALMAVSRSAGAKWFIPTENEWYKAAYYEPSSQGGDVDNYWAYPTRTNTTPNSDQTPGAPSIQSNVCNFYRDDSIGNGFNDGFAVTASTNPDPSRNYLTDAGAYMFSPGPYGTFDQGGNVMEWNEALMANGLEITFRGFRGGHWDTADNDELSAARRRSHFPTIEDSVLGFRVAGIVTVPEPGTIALAAFGTIGLLIAAKAHGNSLGRHASGN